MHVHLFLFISHSEKFAREIDDVLFFGLVFIRGGFEARLPLLVFSAVVEEDHDTTRQIIRRDIMTHVNEMRA